MELKEKFDNFVSRLSEEEVRKELVLCYLQMERCKEVLKGEKVDPVEMMDNGESSDLELFYHCKKVRDEVTYLNEVCSRAHTNNEEEADGEGE